MSHYSDCPAFRNANAACRCYPDANPNRCGSCSQHERITELEGILREAHGVLSTLRPAFRPEYLDRIERAMDPDRLTFAERGAVNYLRMTQPTVSQPDTVSTMCHHVSAAD